MATRDRVALPVSWVHINLTHARIAQLLAAAETHKLASGVLSINRNLANTQALVKVLVSDFTARLPGNVRAAVLRVFTEADHHEAVALVRASEWEPSELIGGL